jgi:hypothetical protein
MALKTVYDDINEKSVEGLARHTHIGTGVIGHLPQAKPGEDQRLRRDKINLEKANIPDKGHLGAREGLADGFSPGTGRRVPSGWCV